MIHQIAELETMDAYKYVVIFARYQERWLFCKHKERSTYETAGGHIEAGETPLEAAKRELYEETGAVDFRIEALFDYRAEDAQSGSNGVVFFAQIHVLGELPAAFEMERVDLFDELPTNLTYPEIASFLWAELQSRRKADFE